MNCLLAHLYWINFCNYRDGYTYDRLLTMRRKTVMRSSVGKSGKLAVPDKRICADQQGFSLVEVITVIVIISLAALFAGPEITNWRPNMRVRGAAREIFSTMQNARMVAIKNNQDVTFAIDTNAKSWEVFVDNGVGTGGIAGDGSKNGEEAQLLFGSIDADYQDVIFDITSGRTMMNGVDAGSGGKTYTVFTSRGLLVSGGDGTVTLCKDRDLDNSCDTNNPRHYRITIGVGGSLQFEMSADGASTWK